MRVSRSIDGSISRHEWFFVTCMRHHEVGAAISLLLQAHPGYADHMVHSARKIRLFVGLNDLHIFQFMFKLVYFGCVIHVFNLGTCSGYAFLARAHELNIPLNSIQCRYAIFALHHSTKQKQVLKNLKKRFNRSAHVAGQGL